MGYSPRDHKDSDISEQLSTDVHACAHTHTNIAIYAIEVQRTYEIYAIQRISYYKELNINFLNLRFECYQQIHLYFMQYIYYLLNF